ncbi:4986_t:CDS:2 [Dentiscutata heterogama]|uniref:4986_t:CDS:1 n=1 Tax=Dentiscutata heterogama TaxID=1316150 RepID=A0ACA9KSF4_9GLOM|nr:4986_t:CDS:2 [Dentiscutata heterogama]
MILIEKSNETSEEPSEANSSNRKPTKNRELVGFHWLHLEIILNRAIEQC